LSTRVLAAGRGFARSVAASPAPRFQRRFVAAKTSFRRPFRRLTSQFRRFSSLSRRRRGGSVASSEALLGRPLADGCTAEEYRVLKGEALTGISDGPGIRDV
jgi:hypothetical protein